MVSVHPNPPPGQGFTRFYNSYFGGDPTTKKTEKDMTASYLSVEDPSKKVRKPYTITKSRESWTEMEHDKFLEALHLFDRDWKKIEVFVGSKTVIQIRSHAQKHFMKVQKNGISEHVPPPRPKRKATHPYPHKAPKKDAVASKPSGPLSSVSLLNPKYVGGPQSMLAPRNITSSEPVYPGACPVPPGCVSPMSGDDFTLSDGDMMHHGSSNIGSQLWASNGTNSQVTDGLIGTREALPDFAQVYSFIGSLFDPSTSDHLEKLQKMDPINIETVLMLIKNLSVNLVSPEFENHRKLLSLHDVDIHKDSLITP